MSSREVEERRGVPMAEILILNVFPPSVRGEQVAQTRATLITLIGAPTSSRMPRGWVDLGNLKEGRTTPRKGARGRLGGGAGRCHAGSCGAERGHQDQRSGFQLWSLGPRLEPKEADGGVWDRGNGRAGEVGGPNCCTA